MHVGRQTKALLRRHTVELREISAVEIRAGQVCKRKIGRQVSFLAKLSSLLLLLKLALLLLLSSEDGSRGSNIVVVNGSSDSGRGRCVTLQSRNGVAANVIKRWLGPVVIPVSELTTLIRIVKE